MNTIRTYLIAAMISVFTLSSSFAGGCFTKQADAPAREVDHPIQQAIIDGNENVVRDLLNENPGRILLMDRQGRTLLHLAARYLDDRNFATFALILNATTHFSINTVSHEGMTALGYAERAGSRKKKIIAALIKRDAV